MSELRGAMLLLALAAAVAGMGGLAVAMPVHWEQVAAGMPQPRRAALALRGLGAVGLLGSLALCLAADHASMASLVWVMTLSAAACAVALLLSWRPGWLRPLARLAAAF